MTFDRYKWQETIARSKVSPQAKGLVLLLSQYVSKDDGSCWPSVVRLAREMDSTDRSVRRWVSELSEAGFLSRIEGEKGWYFVARFPTVSHPDTSVHPPDTHVRVPGHTCPPPRTPVSAPPGHQCPPNHVIEPRQEPGTKPERDARAMRDALSSPLPDSTPRKPNYAPEPNGRPRVDEAQRMDPFQAIADAQRVRVSLGHEMAAWICWHWTADEIAQALAACEASKASRARWDLFNALTDIANPAVEKTTGDQNTDTSVYEGMPWVG